MVDSTPTRITTYFRTRFTLANPASVTNLTFSVMGERVALPPLPLLRTGREFPLIRLKPIQSPT